MAVRVFLYFFEKKIQGENPQYSSYETYIGLRRERQSSLPLYAKSEKISEKKISMCLEDLVSVGFVERVSARLQRAKRTGRLPKCLYQLKSMADIKAAIRSKLRDKEDSISEALDRMSEVEEAAGLMPKGTAVKKGG